MTSGTAGKDCCWYLWSWTWSKTYSSFLNVKSKALTKNHVLSKWNFEVPESLETLRHQAHVFTCNLVQNVSIAESENIIIFRVSFTIENIPVCLFAPWLLHINNYNVDRFRKEGLLKISNRLLQCESKLALQICAFFHHTQWLAVCEKLFLQIQHELSVFEFETTEVSVNAVCCVAPQFVHRDSLTHADKIIVKANKCAEQLVLWVVELFELLSYDRKFAEVNPHA